MHWAVSMNIPFNRTAGTPEALAVPATAFLRTRSHQARRNAMAEQNAAIGIFSSYHEAESGIRELQRAGFDMKMLSIVCRDDETDRPTAGSHDSRKHLKVWDSPDGFWGRTSTLLFGSAYFVIPGMGNLISFGPLTGWIVGAMETAIVVGGLGALAAALLSFGIPMNKSLHYETEVRSHKFLVITHGAPFDVSQARAILMISGATSITVHLGVMWRLASGA
jgi:hypothetical protein